MMNKIILVGSLKQAAHFAAKANIPPLDYRVVQNRQGLIRNDDSIVVLLSDYEIYPNRYYTIISWSLFWSMVHVENAGEILSWGITSPDF